MRLLSKKTTRDSALLPLRMSSWATMTKRSCLTRPNCSKRGRRTRLSVTSTSPLYRERSWRSIELSWVINWRMSLNLTWALNLKLHPLEATLLLSPLPYLWLVALLHLTAWARTLARQLVASRLSMTVVTCLQSRTSECSKTMTPSKRQLLKKPRSVSKVQLHLRRLRINTTFVNTP